MELRLRGETIAPWPRAVAAIASRQSARIIRLRHALFPRALFQRALFPRALRRAPSFSDSGSYAPAELRSRALLRAELGAGSLEQSLGQLLNV